MQTTALIMAGGRGERFWPQSRKNLPKQFLSLTDDGRTMLQLTVDRIRPLVVLEDIFIATNKDYKKLVLEQLPGLPEDNILCEPVGRNTAPCIGLGAVHISRKYEEALMLVLPSDHLVKQNNIFLDIVSNACKVAERNMNLVTIGITPTYPETGYGYIKIDPDNSEGRAIQVERFVEKPSKEQAKRYVSSNQYLWNSGIFIWKVSSILSNMEKLMPLTYAGLMKIKEAIGTAELKQIMETEFEKFESQSIDFGIMERANDIYTLPGIFGWDDVGSWLAIGRINQPNEHGNVVRGKVITVDSKNCIILGEQKLMAVVGLDDLIIIDTPDASLICSKDNTGDIKKVIDILKSNNYDKYL